ncbi:uncharacterized protein ASPGLDRAFT_77366 [Aspergillus glaucus CBS 516.65]|uniref:Amino acid transporter transmembrane domain-containing protein n=1 Tax=Aspergillus glaucus CBS 516.65 TaxID=1160497 RepID=A0A1L9V7R4_ASPGL|nr:hypothetical protein ASPGLDRAFT_77366 [Aspergillus glaucus CBS 516.65]OJJ79968.1 hypothetical protein ASPGLDRAFT_77366 [Aspergillus glaucus CBS 516.65]
MRSQIANVPVPNQHSEVEEGGFGTVAHPSTVDEDKANIQPSNQDAFGNEEFAEVKYKVLKWWQCGLLMVAETISMGILSLPTAFAGLGLAPAIVILVGLGVLATYTGYVIGQFKCRYPHISSVADAGEILLGPIGRELFFIAHMLYTVFIMASHILTFTVAMNTITDHGTCSLVFGVVGLVISFILSVPRTLKRMTWLSLASFASIIAAVFVTMIAVGVQNHVSSFKVTAQTSLVNAFTSVSNVVFAYASHNTFFNMMAELEDYRDYPKALALLQSIDICLYLVTAIVIYLYAGDGVESPALSSAGPLIAKVAYGVALPTIVIAGVIYGHIAFKTMYIRIFAGTDRMHKQDFVAVGSWIGLALSLWVLAWIIASAIPVFNNLLSLMSALFASWFSFGLPGIFWLYLNRGRWVESPRKVLLTMLNVLCVSIGIVLCGLGVYTSGKAIHDDPSSASFSCANNA